MFVCRVCVEQNVYLEVRLNTQLLHQYREFCVLKKSTLQKFDALLSCHMPSVFLEHKYKNSKS